MGNIAGALKYEDANIDMKEFLVQPDTVGDEGDTNRRLAPIAGAGDSPHLEQKRPESFSVLVQELVASSPQPTATQQRVRERQEASCTCHVFSEEAAETQEGTEELGDVLAQSRETLPPGTPPQQQSTVVLDAESPRAINPGPSRCTFLLRGLLVSMVVLLLSSGVLVSITWRLIQEPLGSQLVRNASSLLRLLLNDTALPVANGSDTSEASITETFMTL
ncbi:uncharacterized protein LOC135383921 [Ornithodoros turicata]|uniref:uncharacterized protein LOC135383921 n=1 Tax=Ornithodoros turicata TaxID=34597 RepID=UPI003138E140